MNPKYSVGDVFVLGKKYYGGNQLTTEILYIHSEFYDHSGKSYLATPDMQPSGKSEEVYYCVKSFYKNRPPNHMKESDIDKYLTKNCFFN